LLSCFFPSSGLDDGVERVDRSVLLLDSHNQPLIWGWSDKQFCHPSQVLHRRCQQELIAGTAHPAQSQTIQLQDALEMGKQYFDLFSILA
jgi:hypothetical protein